MKLNERLKLARAQKGFTQQEVADILHISRATVSSWEVGRTLPSLDFIIDLSNLYDLSLDILLKEDMTMVKEFNREIKSSKKRKLIIIILSILLITTSAFAIFKILAPSNKNISYEKLEIIDSKLYSLSDQSLKNGEIKILVFSSSNSIKLKKGQSVKISFDSDRLTFGYFLNSKNYEYDQMFNIFNKTTIGQENIFFDAPIDAEYTFAILGTSSSTQEVKNIKIKIY